VEAKGAVAEQSNLVVDALRKTVGDAFAEDREDAIEVITDRSRKPNKWL
jgi:hypothetical protein